MYPHTPNIDQDPASRSVGSSRPRARLSFRSLTLTSLTLTSLAMGALSLGALTACDDDDFSTIKSNNIAFEPREAAFVPGMTRTRETSTLFELRNTGEAGLEVSAIYLDMETPEGRTRIEGCDFTDEMIPDSTILTPDALPTCSFMIRDRPVLPATIEPNQFSQIEVVYRPLDGLEDPTGARLVIESNGSNERTSFADLLVSRGYPDLSPNIGVIQFPGQGRETYLLRNFGTAPLIIESINLELADPERFPAPEGGMLEFTFDADQEVLGASIDPGDFLRLYIAYTPVDSGVDKTNLIINTNDPDESPFNVLLTSEERPANLEISPGALTFTHAAGVTDIQTVTFSNTGLRPLNAFLSIDPPEGAYRISPLDSDSLQVQAGAESSIRIEYIAGEAPTDATLVVDSSEADNAVDGGFRIPLRTMMDGSLKLLDTDQSTLSFDGVAAGESAEATLTLTSSGDTAVEITSIELEGTDLDIARFSVADSTGSTLAPGATRELNLSFSRPGDEAVTNAYQAQLVIRSDSDAGDTIITLVANP